MLLAYVDESGTNYAKRQRYWVDGPYSLWSCVLISEKKYFDIERGLQELAVDILGRTARRAELHANVIWESRLRSSRREAKVRKYFEELIQFASKLRIPVMYGIQQKNFSIRSTSSINRELNNARYSLVTLLEHELAERNETAVIVSDTETQEELKNLVSQRTEWRYSPPGRRPSGRRPKFIYEYRSNFILDQLHYVDSKSSLLIQFSDHISFVLKRCLEHLYLLEFPAANRPVPDKDFVPITEPTFNTFINFCNIKFAQFEQKDVNMGELSASQKVYYPFQRRETVTIMGSNSFSDVIRSFTPYK